MKKLLNPIKLSKENGKLSIRTILLIDETYKRKYTTRITLEIERKLMGIPTDNEEEFNKSMEDIESYEKLTRLILRRF